MKRKRSKSNAKSDEEKPKKRRKPNKSKKVVESMNLKELRKTLIDLTYNHPELQDEVVGMAPKTDVNKAGESLCTISRKASRASSGRYSSNNQWSMDKASGFVKPWEKELLDTLGKMQKKGEFKEMKRYLKKAGDSIDLFPTKFYFGGGNHSLKGNLEESLKKGYLKLVKIKKLGFENADFEEIIEDIKGFDFEKEISELCEKRKNT